MFVINDCLVRVAHYDEYAWTNHNANIQTTYMLSKCYLKLSLPDDCADQFYINVRFEKGLRFCRCEI